MTPLELFFDLVFVLALTQCTALMAANPTWEGLAQGLLILGLMWWAWTGYAWLTSVVEPEEGAVRIVIFAAMAAFSWSALCIPEAFGERGAPVRVRVRRRALRRRSRCSWSRAATMPALRHSVITGLVGQHRARASALLVRRRVRRHRAAGGAVGARAGARHGRAAAVRRGGLEARARALRRAPRPDRDHRAGGVDRRDRRRAPRSASTPGSWSAAVLGIVVAAALWWLYFDVVALVAERRLSRAAVGARAERDRARLLLLPAPPDGRRDHPARARHEEDARRRGGPVEGRAGRRRCSAAPRCTCSRTSPFAGATSTRSTSSACCARCCWSRWSRSRSRCRRSRSLAILAAHPDRADHLRGAALRRAARPHPPPARPRGAAD